MASIVHEILLVAVYVSAKTSTVMLHRHHLRSTLIQTLNIHMSFPLYGKYSHYSYTLLRLHKSMKLRFFPLRRGSLLYFLRYHRERRHEQYKKKLFYEENASADEKFKFLFSLLLLISFIVTKVTSSIL